MGEESQRHSRAGAAIYSRLRLRAALCSEFNLKGCVPFNRRKAKALNCGAGDTHLQLAIKVVPQCLLG